MDENFSLGFPVESHEYMMDIEFPPGFSEGSEVANELRELLTDNGLVPYTRVQESFDPGTATIVAAIITGNSVVLAAVLTAFLGRKKERSLKIKDHESYIEIKGHSQNQEERILRAIQEGAARQKARSEKMRAQPRVQHENEEQ